MEQSQSHSQDFCTEQSDSELLVVDSTSESIIITPRTPSRVVCIESSIWSCHMLSIIDMAWNALEVLFVLLCLLPQDDIGWEIAVIFLLPNIIQLIAAILMFKMTEQTENLTKIYRCCQLWLFLAFVTLLCNTTFIVWITITNVITIFFIFAMIMKICWRFTAIFFVNEVHNELEAKQFLACESEADSVSQSPNLYNVVTPDNNRDDLNLLRNEYINESDDEAIFPYLNDDSGTNGNFSDNSNSSNDDTGNTVVRR